MATNGRRVAAGVGSASARLFLTARRPTTHHNLTEGGGQFEHSLSVLRWLAAL